MKRLLSHIILFMALFLAASHDIHAATSILEGDFYYTFSGTEATVMAQSPGSATSIYTGSMAIPSSVTHNGKAYTVTAIGTYAFYKSTGLTSITIPSTVTSIGQSAFNSCTSLTSISIPNSVTTIGVSAFGSCSTLSSVSIGSGIKSIGREAFYGCSISSFTCLAETPPSTGSDVFKSMAFTLFVPHGCKGTYSSDAFWGSVNAIEEINVQQATGISFPKTKTFILVGKSTNMQPVISPEDSGNQSLTWKSSDSSIAVTDMAGNITGITAGTAVITATTTDGSNLSASYKIMVFEPGLPGDLNGDGDITIADANAIVNMFLKE